MSLKSVFFDPNYAYKLIKRKVSRKAKGIDYSVTMSRLAHTEVGLVETKDQNQSAIRHPLDTNFL